MFTQKKFSMSWVNPLTAGNASIINTVATDALVLKHQAISTHSVEQVPVVLDQFRMQILHLQQRTLENKIMFWKIKWSSCLRVNRDYIICVTHTWQWNRGTHQTTCPGPARLGADSWKQKSIFYTSTWSLHKTESSVFMKIIRCRTCPMPKPKCLMRGFINLNRIYKAHQTNVWWTMKVFRLHWIITPTTDRTLSFWMSLCFEKRCCNWDKKSTLPQVPSYHHSYQWNICTTAINES